MYFAFCFKPSDTLLNYSFWNITHCKAISIIAKFHYVVWCGFKSITNHMGVTLTSFKSFRWTGDFDSSVTHLQTCHLSQFTCFALCMCLKLNFTRFTAQI